MAKFPFSFSIYFNVYRRFYIFYQKHDVMTKKALAQDLTETK